MIEAVDFISSSINELDLDYSLFLNYFGTRRGKHLFIMNHRIKLIIKKQF